MTSPLCACGSKKAAETCCPAIIEGRREAVTAEQLMRSRYVAFTRADVDYLMRSQHSTTRNLSERKSITQWAKSVKWAGLLVLKTEAGQADDTKGMVEFRALYFENGKLEQIHERSLFERENGLWVYVSGA